MTEQRTVRAGLVLRGEAELGHGRASVSDEHPGSRSAGEAAAGEAACLLHPLLCKQDDWGNRQDSEPSHDAPLSQAHCGLPTPCLGFSGSSARSSRLPRRCKLEDVLYPLSVRGKPACVKMASDVSLLFGFSVRWVDMWVL